jgi:hypothetical protein
MASPVLQMTTTMLLLRDDDSAGSFVIGTLIWGGVLLFLSVVDNIKKKSSNMVTSIMGAI